jgi:polyhydroxyalkanoate synthesis regulator phasin
MAEKTESNDMLERMFLLGVGAFSLTKEKVDGVVDDLVSRGRISQEEGDDLIHEIGTKGAEQRDAVSGFMSEQFDKLLAAGKIASRADIERLEAQIAALRAELHGETVVVEEEFPEDSC